VGLEQIKSTGIGKVVKGFTKTEFSPDVQALSAKLIESWTKLVVSNVETPSPDEPSAKRVKTSIPASSLSMANLNVEATSSADVKSYKRVDDTTTKKKKRVTFATGSHLCQVRLFHSVEPMVSTLI
jgi:hypothetical protein